MDKLLSPVGSDVILSEELFGAVGHFGCVLCRPSISIAENNREADKREQ